MNILLSLLCFACFQAPTVSDTAFYYRLSVQNRDSTSRHSLLLSYSAAGSMRTDTLEVKGAKAEFTRKIPHPVPATLVLVGQAAPPLEVFLANEPLELRLGQKVEFARRSLLQENYTRMIHNDAVRRSYFPRYGELTASNDSVGLAQLSVIFDSLRREDLIFVRQYFDVHSTSALSLFAFQRLTAFLTDYAEAAPDFDLLPSWAKLSPEGQVIQRKISGATAVAAGKTTPDFSQSDAFGREISIGDFQGKYVLLDFWASWCGPCRKEHPFLRQIYAQYQSKGFEIISVSLDSDRKAWLDAVAKDSLTWTSLSDLQGPNNQVALLFGIQAIPSNLLLDAQGVIVAKNMKREELVEFLAKR